MRIVYTIFFISLVAVYATTAAMADTEEHSRQSLGEKQRDHQGAVKHDAAKLKRLMLQNRTEARDVRKSQRNLPGKVLGQPQGWPFDRQ